MKKILDGMMVLDLTRFFSGPQSTLLLAGMGAEVIKIDDPKNGDPTAFAPPFAGSGGVSFERMSDQDMGLAYLKRARGKKSATLNLKSPEGQRIFLQMATHADVIVENFSAGVTRRLGIDYETVAAVNPRIIYCSLTGYGATGPDRDAKAYDLMVQAAVGLVGLTGHEGSGPVKAATPLSDAIAGAMAASGVVAALLHRERTGEGQAVDVSMADCLFSLLFDEPIDCYERLGVSARQANRAMRFSPFNVYPALDGWVAIGVATADDWTALVRIIGANDLGDAAGQRNVGWRLANNAAIDEAISAWTRGCTRWDIVQTLTNVHVPCSTVRSIDEVMQWQQLRAREMIVPLWNPLTGTAVAAEAPGFPVKFSRTPASYDSPAPVPGSHSEEVLGRFAGIQPAALVGLRARGIV
jgi:crotonobetainyl-CoA:carnitine CoA-transferase CaiB-like acyl-CoA transferase